MSAFELARRVGCTIPWYSLCLCNLNEEWIIRLMTINRYVATVWMNLTTTETTEATTAIRWRRRRYCYSFVVKMMKRLSGSIRIRVRRLFVLVCVCLFANRCRRSHHHQSAQKKRRRMNIISYWQEDTIWFDLIWFDSNNVDGWRRNQSTSERQNGVDGMMMNTGRNSQVVIQTLLETKLNLVKYSKSKSL